MPISLDTAMQYLANHGLKVATRWNFSLSGTERAATQQDYRKVFSTLYAALADVNEQFNADMFKITVHQGFNDDRLLLQREVHALIAHCALARVDGDGWTFAPSA